MSQLADMFVDALVGICVADENTEFVDQLIVDARAAITAGKGNVSSLLNSGLNGKSFGRAIYLNPVEVLNCAQTALDRYNEESQEICSSYPDFRRLIR